MIKLSDYMDQEIRVLLSLEGQDQAVTAILRGVDSGGIFLEMQKLTDEVLGILKMRAAPRTPVIFIPYHVIVSIVVPMDSPSISDKELF
jgi:hypothetical protein